MAPSDSGVTCSDLCGGGYGCSFFFLFGLLEFYLGFYWDRGLDLDLDLTLGVEQTIHIQVV